MKKEYLGYLPGNIDSIYKEYLEEKHNTRKMELLFETYGSVLRYFGCIFLNEYLKKDYVSDDINNTIIALARPSLGSWLGFIFAYVVNAGSDETYDCFITEFAETYAALYGDDTISRSHRPQNCRYIKSTAEFENLMSEILLFRNGIAHGALYPTEEEAGEIITHLDACLDIILSYFYDIFQKYHIEKCVNVAMKGMSYYAYFEMPENDAPYDHTIQVKSKSAVSVGDMYIIDTDGRFFLMDEFLVDLVDEDHSESYYLYDGYGNKKVVYLGIKEKFYIARYFDLIKKKFVDKKDLSMKWTTEGFDMDNFKGYINGLTDFTLEVHKNSGKYNPQSYVVRNIDYIVDDFINSDKTTLVVTAEAGVGKTNFLCHTAETYARNCAVYFYNGSDMTGVNISNQLFKKLQDNCLDADQFDSADYFLAFIEKNNPDKIPFVIIIDAVNEAYDVAGILKEIDDLTSKGGNYSWLKIILSIRTVAYKLFVDKTVNATGKDFLLYTNRDRYFAMNDADEKITRYNIEIKEWNILQVIDAFEKYCSVNGMTSTGDDFLRLSSETKKMLCNPLNMSLYFKAKKGNKDAVITSERELFAEIYRSLRESMNMDIAEAAGITHVNAQLQSDIVELMLKDRKNEVDIDAVIEISDRLTSERDNDYRLLILPPYQRLIDEGVIYEKSSEELRVFSFVYQKYLEYLIYTRIKDKNDDENTVAEQMLEAYDYQKLPEAFMAYRNAMEDNFDKISALEAIVSAANSRNIPLSGLQSVFSEMIENLLVKTSDYTDELVNFIMDNNLTDMAINLVHQIYEKELTDESMDLAERLLAKREELSEKNIVELLYRKALAMQKISEYQRAMELFDECIRIGDGDRTNVFYVEKSKTYRKLNDLDMALKILDDRFDDSREDIPYIDLAWIQKGLCYNAMGDTDRALEYYEMALPLSRKREDHFNVIYNELGITSIYNKKNRLREALELSEQVCRDANKYGYITLLSDGMNALANSYRMHEMYEEAIKCAKQGLTIWEESKYYVGQMRMHEHIIDSMVHLKRPVSEIEIEIEMAEKTRPFVREKVILEGYESALKLFEEYKNS